MAAAQTIPMKVAQNPLARQWSAATRFVQSIIDPIRGNNVHPFLKNNFQAVGNYDDAQLMRIDPVVTAVKGSIERAFGTPGAMDGREVISPNSWLVKPPPARQKKKLADYNDMLPYVGTLFHVLQNPEEYLLTNEQKIAVALYHFVVNEDFRLSQQSGVKLPSMVHNWVHHGLKYTDDQLQGAGEMANTIVKDMPTFMNLPSWAKARKSTLEGFIRATNKINKERVTNGLSEISIDTNIENMLYRRLVGGAHLRSVTLFANQLQDMMKGAGMVVAPNGSLNIAGKSFPFPYAPEVKGLALNDIKAAMEPLVIPSDISWAQHVFDQMRAVKLNVDVGVLGRQGMQLFSYRPHLYAQALAETINAVTSSPYRWALWLAHNSYTIDRAVSSGLVIRPNSDLIVSGTTALGRVVPGIDWVNKQQFERFLPIAKIHMWNNLLQDLKDMRDYPAAKAAADKLPFYRELNARLTSLGGKLRSTTSDESLEKIASHIVNQRLGGINWKEVGFRPRPLEQFMFLTPGWIRGNIGTIISALSDWGPEGMMTRRLIAQDFTNQVLWSEGLAALSPNDHSGDLSRYDPRSSHFMSVKWGEGYYGVSPSVRYWKILAHTVLGAKDSPSEDVVSQRFDDLLRFGRSTLNTPVAALMDGITKHDFFGRPLETPLDWFRWSMGLFAPIIGTTLIGSMNRGLSPSDVAAQVGANTVGINTAMPSLGDYRQEATKGQPREFFTEAQQKWMDTTGQTPSYAPIDGTPERPDLLEAGQKRNIDMLPQIQDVDAKMNAGKSAEISRINDYRENRAAQQYDDELAKGTITRKEWRDSMSTLVRSHGSELRKVGIREERIGAGTSEEGSYNAAIDGYLKLFEDAYGNAASIPQEAQDKLSGELSRYVASLDESHNDYLFRNLHKNLTSEGKQYYRDLPQISEFLNIRQQLLDSIPLLKDFYEVQVPAMRAANGEAIAQLMINRSPQSAFLNDQLDIRRKVYLFTHKDEAKLVAKWFPDMQTLTQAKMGNSKP